MMFPIPSDLNPNEGAISNPRKLRFDGEKSPRSDNLEKYLGEVCTYWRAGRDVVYKRYEVVQDPRSVSYHTLRFFIFWGILAIQMTG